MKSLVIRRLFAMTVCAAALAASASAYYHFVHFAGRTGPFTRIPEKFDLSRLPDGKVSFYVSAQGPETLVDGDSRAGVMSQIRLAGQVWNGVDTSALRLAWGGQFTPDTAQATPHVEVLFEEIPPGLLAMGGPTARGDVVTPEGGDAFVPITKSVVILNKDLTSRPGYSTGFFLTVVHEMGHAIGLQHTAASSVMSTDSTRASTKASPLGADDIAGLSVLYPNAKFAGRFGSIAGRVAIGDNGVHLASVVALSEQRQAVAALTNPDGTYRIDGLESGNYTVYAHALPPSVQSDLGPSETVLPVDGDGKSFGAGDAFGTQFYPGTQDPLKATQVAVKAGAEAAEVNFAVEKKAAPSVYGVSTYSFQGSVAIKPAYLNVASQTRPAVAAIGTGIADSNGATPGLNVSVIGGAITLAENGVRPYKSDPSILQLIFNFNPFSNRGPKHLVFSTPDEVFVLPSGLTLVNKQPPSIAEVKSGTDDQGHALVTVTGDNLFADTRILFDGAQATVLSADANHKSLTIAVPPASAGYRANVVALNSDGQSSLFLGNPYSYTYGSGMAPAGSMNFSVSPATQTAGTEGMIQITGSNMNFADGQTSVGFGTSDVMVRRVWVVSPAVIRAEVSIAANARVDDTSVTVVSGLQSVTLSSAFHIKSGDDEVTALGSDMKNTEPERAGVYPGSTATLPVFHLPSKANASNVTLQLNDRNVAVTSLDGGTITFRVPDDFVPGLAVARLTVPDATVAPVIVEVQVAPPDILAASVGGVGVDAEHPVRTGDAITLAVLHLGEDGADIDASRMSLTIGGVAHLIPAAAQALEGNPKVHVVRATVGTAVATGDKVPVVLTLDGRASIAFYIPIAE